MPRQRKKPPQEKINWFSIFTVIGLPFIGWIGGNLWSGVRIANNLATKGFVEEINKQTIKYTDDKIMQTLKDAFEHSDTNRRDMMQQTQSWIAEIRTSDAVSQTKLDNLTKAIQDMKEEHRPQRR